MSAFLMFFFSDCQCNITGSLSTDCDSKGQCTCKTELITGEKCSDCKEGHINFPECTGISFCDKYECFESREDSTVLNLGG